MNFTPNLFSDNYWPDSVETPRQYLRFLLRCLWYTITINLMLVGPIATLLICSFLHLFLSEYSREIYIYGYTIFEIIAFLIAMYTGINRTIDNRLRRIQSAYKAEKDRLFKQVDDERKDMNEQKNKYIALRSQMLKLRQEYEEKLQRLQPS